MKSKILALSKNEEFKKLIEQKKISNKYATIFFGKLVGSDELGNKYYESRNGKRWVIYANSIDASKIPVEWYSWMHFTPNKIEKNHNLKKYKWQKPHQANLTGTDASYYPNKNKENVIEKKYKKYFQFIAVSKVLCLFRAFKI